MFVTRRPRGAKPQVKEAQGLAGRPNPLAGRQHLESVKVETWWLRSYVSSQEHPMPDSPWKPEGVADRPCGWLPGHPSHPNRLNQVGGSSPRPQYKGPHAITHTHHTILVVLHM
jgi:hypothetical protein